MLREFARDLKTIREQKDISLKSISQQTRLNLSVLESLESGDFTFQPQTYIRAFLKQYIAALDLDVEEVLFDYDLARSGKYRPKFVHEPEAIPEAETEAEQKNEDESVYEELPGKVETIKSNSNKDKQEKESSSEVYHELPEIGNKVRIVRDPPVKPPTARTETVSEGPSFNFMGSKVARNIIFIILGLLILAGIYSLISILFLEGSKDNPEIIRQNFDEVVKEQEKRLLGKKTPEEIKDSIKKANDAAKLVNDSVTLKINALEYGEIYVVTDSVNYSDPKKVIYNEGDVKIFKAKTSLHITTGNTKTFEATLNGNPLVFDTKAVRKVKLTKEGLQK